MVLPVVALVTRVADGGPAVLAQFAAIMAQIAHIMPVIAPGMAELGPVAARLANIAHAAIMANFCTLLADIGTVVTHFGALLQNFGTMLADVLRGLRLRHSGDERRSGKRSKNELSHESWLLLNSALRQWSLFGPDALNAFGTGPSPTGHPCRSSVTKHPLTTRIAAMPQRGCANHRAQQRFRPRLSCA